LHVLSLSPPFFYPFFWTQLENGETKEWIVSEFCLLFRGTKLFLHRKKLFGFSFSNLIIRGVKRGELAKVSLPNAIYNFLSLGGNGMASTEERDAFSIQVERVFFSQY
jgi:hypothetical protein